MLGPRESRTLSALDLEQGAHGLTGALGDGAGKWRLSIAAEHGAESLIGMSVLVDAAGHMANLSTAVEISGRWRGFTSSTSDSEPGFQTEGRSGVQ